MTWRMLANEVAIDSTERANIIREKERIAEEFEKIRKEVKRLILRQRSYCFRRYCNVCSFLNVLGLAYESTGRERKSTGRLEIEYRRIRFEPGL